jgi:hypothetical protein
MYPFLLGVFVVLGGIPLIVLVRGMTRDRPSEKYERRAWTAALLSANAALIWTILRILRAFSDAASPSAPPVMEVLADVSIVILLVIGLPALVALALTVVATRRYRRRQAK